VIRAARRLRLPGGEQGRDDEGLAVIRGEPEGRGQHRIESVERVDSAENGVAGPPNDVGAVATASVLGWSEPAGSMRKGHRLDR
jgi:hypothetical protein